MILRILYEKNKKSYYIKNEAHTLSNVPGINNLDLYPLNILEYIE